MSDKKCRKCQSFCMLGYQLAGTAPDKKNDYPTTWKDQWQKLKDKTIQGDGSSEKTPKTLTAKSQQDLIQFIIDTYTEGKINCASDNGYFNKKDCKSLDTLTNIENFVQYDCRADVNDATANERDIIETKHFNNFLKLLSGSFSPVDKDGRGDSLENPNSTNDNAPVVGWYGDGTYTYVNNDKIVEQISARENDHSSDKSLIKGSLWESLRERASKLMYHPYQCNICNIYEGGQFGEVVRELGGYLIQHNPEYSWTQSTALSDSILGINNIKFRQDCSGFVSACVGIYAALLGKNEGKYYSCDQVSGNFKTLDSGALDAMNVKDEFVDKLNAPAGCIGMIFATDGHVEASDDTGAIWSGGGCGGCINNQANNCHENAQMMTKKTNGKTPSTLQAKESVNMTGQAPDKDESYNPAGDSSCSQTSGDCSETTSPCGETSSPCSSSEVSGPCDSRQGICYSEITACQEM